MPKCVGPAEPGDAPALCSSSGQPRLCDFAAGGWREHRGWSLHDWKWQAATALCRSKQCYSLRAYTHSEWSQCQYDPGMQVIRRGHLQLTPNEQPSAPPIKALDAVEGHLARSECQQDQLAKANHGSQSYSSITANEASAKDPGNWYAKRTLQFFLVRFSKYLSKRRVVVVVRSPPQVQPKSVWYADK